MIKKIHTHHTYLLWNRSNKLTAKLPTTQTQIQQEQKEENNHI